MWVWISEDSKYYAVPPERGCDHESDVYTIDGKQCWLAHRYEPKGFDDTDKRFLYPEFAHMTCGYSQIGGPPGYRDYAFRLSFGDYDKNIKIIPWTGNTCLKSYQANFKRRVNIKRSLLEKPKELVEAQEA